MYNVDALREIDMDQEHQDWKQLCEAATESAHEAHIQAMQDKVFASPGPFSVMSDQLMQLVIWLNESDPNWKLSPQAHAQFIIDILREHGVTAAQEYKIGVKR